MNTRYDVIVVGVGAMGSAACYVLARRGVRVLGLEQFGIPHALGSAHGESRMIRLCYYEHPDYVPLLHRAYELWHELEQSQPGGPSRGLFHVTGGVYMGPADSEFVLSSLRAAEVHGLPHELLTRERLAERFSQFQLPPDHIGLYEPNAGILVPERVVSTYAELALRHGAVLHGHEPVESWQAQGGAVNVRTQHRSYSADRLVVCGGAWSSRLLGDLGVPLVVTRQVMGWVWPRRREPFELGAFPVWAIDNPDATQHYGFPMLPGGLGLKIAHHFQNGPADPDSIDRQVQPDDESDFRPTLRRFIPQADGPLLAIRVCMYTNSPDSHFIIDRHPRHECVVLACGFSGHGFKFASVIGEVLADLAVSGRTDLPIEFLGLDRFRR